MANRSGLVRRIPIASGSDWDGNTLQAFRITVVRERSFSAFFGVEAPARFDDPNILEFLDLDLLSIAFGRIAISTIQSSMVRFVVKDVVAVTKTHRHEESAEDDLSRSLLHMFGYDDGDYALRTRTVLDMFMSLGKTQAIPDIVVERLDTAVKMLVQEDKSYDDRHLKGHHPEEQLIAEAIAAYQENVRLYERLGKEDFPDQQLIPGIVMLGTCPTFYLIPITKALADCVRNGVEPDFPTEVRKFVIPNIPAVVPDAMLDKASCFTIAQCLSVFKRFVN